MLVRIAVLARRGGVLIKQMSAYQQTGSTNGMKILILGDSLAYGTGASSPQTSLAGRIGKRFPDAHITNQGKNGMRTKGLAEEMKQLTDHYDLIVIVVGGNDLIHPWLDLDRAAKNLETIYKTASTHADQVISLTTGNLRHTSFFLWPLNHYFGKRSIYLRNQASNIADTLPNVTYIDLVKRNQSVPFGHLQEAPDHLHLSDDGTNYWYEAIADTTHNFTIFEHQSF